MGAQHELAYFVAVEGVLRIARGMVLRDVERFEVVVIEFDFGPVEHLVAHRQEEIFELSRHLGDGVQAASLGARWRQGRVEVVGASRGVESG